MAEAATGEGKGSTIGTWIKSLVGAVFGLLSGACLMYVSPLIDRVVKPNKPVANFSYEAQGLKVTFQNRSVGGGEGWWDFGDGSALEPFAANQEAITHPYSRPGVYTAKLSLRSLLGDENERSVNVQLDSGSGAPPEIAAFEVSSIRPDAYAPATFRVVGKVNNADLCIWTCGSDQPLEVLPDPPANQERYVTFKEPGKHLIKLAAVQGKRVVERTSVVKVDTPPAGAASLVLNVTDEAIQVENFEIRRNVMVMFPAKLQEGAFSFSEDVLPTRPGFQIIKARLAESGNDKSFKDVKVEVSADHTRAKLTGQLLKPSGLFNRNAPLPARSLGVMLTQERQTAPAVLPGKMVATTLAVPGTTLVPIPPMPAGWMTKQRKITVDLSEGQRQVWQNAALPSNASVVMQNRPWRINAINLGDQVRIEVAPIRQGLSATGN